MTETPTSTDQDFPAVRVLAMTLGLAPGQAPSEWYACCTDAVWVRHTGDRSSCNWYGESRSNEREARADAARHRRAHKVAYLPAEGGAR